MNMDKLREECGVVGIFSNKDIEIGFLLYLSMISLQHRGQESAGIVTLCNNEVSVKKGSGLVQEVFNGEDIRGANGNVGIAHVRYSTTGVTNTKNIQPFSFTHKKIDISYAHNGNLVNYKFLRKELEEDGFIFRTDSDSEVIAHVFTKNFKGDYVEALIKTMNTIKGAFAINMVIDNKLIAIRDPFGIRPLVLGRIDNGYIVASESVALDTIGAELIRDIKAGEMIIIDENGIKSIQYSKNTKLAHSAFEYVYFARPDSVIDGRSVYKTRLEAGRILAKNYPVDADIVIPVPDSGRSAAIGYAEVSGLEYGEGLIKNKYIGRSFIQPTQQLRDMCLNIKLNVLKEIIYNKRIVLIDDSIVRGTTIKKIVKMLKRAGAKEVHLRISSPIVKYPSFYGIDTPNSSELVGSYMTVDEICNMVDADSLCFLTVDELVESIGLKKDELCLDLFTGNYPVPIDDLSFID